MRLPDVVTTRHGLAACLVVLAALLLASEINPAEAGRRSRSRGDLAVVRLAVH